MMELNGTQLLTMDLKMKRGDILWADLEPTIGQEIQKIRPVLVVSNNASNKKSGLVTIIPLSSQMNRPMADFEVFLPSSTSGLEKDSRIMAHQIRTLSKERVQSKTILYHLSSQEMEQVDRALKTHLSLQ